MLLSKIKSREGGRHFVAKNLLQEWIIKGNALFEDNHELYYINSTWDFSSLESVVPKDSDSLEPYMCGGVCCAERLDFDECQDPFDITENRPKFNQNILCKDDEQISFKAHPCSLCKYKHQVDVIFIFDIAFAKKGNTRVAIEIVDTSPPTESKLKYCERYGIDLIVVFAREVLAQNKKRSNVHKAKIYHNAYNSILNIIK